MRSAPARLCGHAGCNSRVLPKVYNLACFLLRLSLGRLWSRSKGQYFMSDKPDQKDTSNGGVRHARMRIETTVLMIRGNESFPTELEDISATGLLLHRPYDWPGRAGQTWVLDMIFGRDLHIHLEAVVARMSDRWIGMAYSRIPEDKQEALWNLLGGYADKLETWRDD